MRRRGLLRRAPAGSTATFREGIVRDALAIIAHPQLAPLFGPDSRAEAAIVGTMKLPPDGKARPVSGQIDRLAVSAGEVLFADFKTGARPPATLDEVPAGYVSQLALYERLLADIFPDKSRRAFLVWTAGASIMEIPPSRLAAARLTID